MNRRGFTFIELVTVWAIIAILAAILFPVFARVKAKGHQINCLNNLANIGIALKTYAQDHYGHFPPENNNLWPLMPNHLPDSAALICPSAEQQRTGGPARPPKAPAYGGNIDYVYWGGWCDDDKPNTVIAADDVADRHNDGANYLSLDGHAKWFTTRSFGREKRLPTGFDELRRLQKPLPPPPFPPPGGPGPPGMGPPGPPPGAPGTGGPPPPPPGGRP